MSGQWSCALVAISGIALGAPAPGRASAQTGTTVSVQGAMHHLVCRGKAGIRLRVEKDPSPRDISGKYVAMVLEYSRPSAVPGEEYQNLQPGECSWNRLGFAGVPLEPGRVYFDVLREAQPWSALETRQLDTTIKAGAFFPDPISLPRYLGDPSHYWGFFVEDANHFSGSFGPYRETAQPRYVTVSGPVGAAVSADARKELRCRGGASGLTFTRGGSAGTNLVNMTLAYRVSANEPGATGRTLDPGGCAWVDRKDMAREPGRVNFTTAGNAQLHQIQSGGTVDRSATAAERYPDANTIPVYLTDPGRYWTFTVTVGSPNTARAHAAWKPDLLDVLTSKPPSSQPTTVALGEADRFAKTRSKADPVLNASRVGITMREVVRRPGEAWLRFSARANVTPMVYYGTQPPVRSSNTGLLGIPNSTPVAVRRMSESGFAAEYSTAPMKNLPQGTKYYFVIVAPEASNTPPQSYGGEFTSMTQTVVVRFTRMQILNDSDKGSSGDLSFLLSLAPSPNVQAECRVATDCANRFFGRSWETGSTNSLANVLRLSQGPNRIRVWVIGWDVDTEDPAYLTDIMPGGGAYSATGGSDSNRDWNTAKAEFDVGVRPELTRVGIPFKLRSIDGNVLMFEVYGEIEVTRQ